MSKFDDEHDKRLRAIQAMSDELDVLCRRARIMHDALKDELRVMRDRDRSTAADAPSRRPRKSTRARRSPRS